MTDKPNDNPTFSCAKLVGSPIPRTRLNLLIRKPKLNTCRYSEKEKDIHGQKFSSKVGYQFPDTAKMLIKEGDSPILETGTVPKFEIKINEKLQHCQSRLARRIQKYKKSRMMSGSAGSLSNSCEFTTKYKDEGLRTSSEVFSSGQELQLPNLQEPMLEKKSKKPLAQQSGFSNRPNEEFSRCDYVRKLLSPAETVPAKLKADGISVFYSTRPPPSTCGSSSTSWSLNFDGQAEQDFRTSQNFWSSTSLEGSSESTKSSTSKPLCPKGKVTIDSKIDFSPQVIHDEECYSTSPAYSILYDDDGNSVVHAIPYQNSSDEQAQDNYPSSWENVDHNDQLDKDEVRIRSANAWSDPGVTFHSSSEMFLKLDRFKTAKVSRLSLTNDPERKPKCASDSNLQDAVIMMEPGLRRIRKDSYTTTASLSTSQENFGQNEPADVCKCGNYGPHTHAEYSETRMVDYQDVSPKVLIEESGFYSYPWECEGQDLSWDQYDHQLPVCLCNGQSRSYFCLLHQEEDHRVEPYHHYFQPPGYIRFIQTSLPSDEIVEPHWVKNLCDSSLSLESDSFSQINNVAKIFVEDQTHQQDDYQLPSGNVSSLLRQNKHDFCRKI